MKKNSKKLRTLVALAIVAVVAVGFVTNVGIGTMSAPGIWDISILCPLGALGTMLASKMMVPRAVISLIVMVLLIVLSVSDTHLDVYKRQLVAFHLDDLAVAHVRYRSAARQEVEHLGLARSEACLLYTSRCV